MRGMRATLQNGGPRPKAAVLISATQTSHKQEKDIL
jgi:hypothetical protein